jgi:DNA-binding IclR family transcriptional regulator
MRAYSAPAAACAAELLLLLTRESSVSLAAMTRALGSSKTLVFRVVRELEARELVQRDETGVYRLGIAALALGGAYAAQASYVNTARDVLRDLADGTGETANLGVLRGAEVMCLINQEGRNVIATFWNAGDRLPAQCTALGKALLAELSPEDVRVALGPDLPKLTPNSIVNHAELARQLEVVRARGYATAHGEAIYGLNAIAVTARLPGRSSELAGMSISMSEDKFGAREAEFLDLLLAGRERIERETSGLRLLATRP